nr:hypothetical protein [Tanacetum cinerariifolium]
MLASLGFGVKWRNWIQACLKSARSSILVNGSPTSEFSIKRGLRQGDPLGLFLFIIIMEGLHLALKDAVRSSLLRAKSNVYGIGVSLDDIVDMARATRCASGILPFIYLGLRIGSKMNLIANWQSLIDRFCGKLSSWKASLLLIGGGLGVRSLKAFNLALLQKWRWHLVNNPDVLWAYVFKAIHRIDTGLDEKGCKTKVIKQKIKAWNHNVRQGDVSHYREVILRLVEIEGKLISVLLQMKKDIKG